MASGRVLDLGLKHCKFSHSLEALCCVIEQDTLSLLNTDST